MEEEKSGQKIYIHLIRLLCVVALFVSTGGIFWSCFSADKRGELDVMAFDRENCTLMPTEALTNQCNAWFWLGIGAALILFATAGLREAPTGKKVFGGIVALLLLGVNMAINGTMASFAFVDLGLGLKPKCELSEEGGGEFLRASHKIDSTVAVYFVLEDRAFRVDGYDSKEGHRTYVAERMMDILLWPWQITINDKNGVFWTRLVYPDDPGYDY